MTNLGTYLGYAEIHMESTLNNYADSLIHHTDNLLNLPRSVWKKLAEEDYLYVHAYRESEDSYNFIFSNYQEGDPPTGMIVNSNDCGLGSYCYNRYLHFIKEQFDFSLNF